MLFCSIIHFDSGIKLPVQSSLNEKNIIIIDAGHGGFDGGAVATDGTVEKNINLNIALALGEMLSKNGYEVIYTRTEDVGTEDNVNDVISKRKKSDLNNRLNLMKKYPDSIFVSIHLNKFTSGNAQGAQVFYSPTFEEANKIGNSIQQSIKKLMQPENDRVIKKGNKSTFLLYNAYVPTVIVECGFLSNKAELEKLKDETYQKQMAFSIFNGIMDYYDLDI